MPLYEYACPGCGARLEKMRKLSERAEGPDCPECGEATVLALSAPGRVGGAGGGDPLPTMSGGSACGPGGCGVSFD